jgi:hypothetical protein
LVALSSGDRLLLIMGLAYAVAALTLALSLDVNDYFTPD